MKARYFIATALIAATVALGGMFNSAKAEDGTAFAASTKTGLGVGADVVAGIPVGMWLFTASKAVYECATHKYDCTTSKVASADDLRSERFASAGIDTRKASMTAVASNLGDETRAKLVADYNRALGGVENYAAVR